MAPVEIVVPASTANLGSGFDTLAVALRLYTRVRILETMPSRPDVIESVFVDGTFTGENRIETAFKYARLQLGIPTPGVRIEVQTDIPRRAGLGSSAAATVAGLQLYGALTTPRPPLEWLGLSSEVEGHPDNAAASLLGGITASCQLDDGRVTATAWRWPDDIQLVIATPDVPLDTAYARSVLPGSVRMRDAVYNLQRAVLLIRALESRQYGDIRVAMGDRWHQPYRQPLVPVLGEAMQLEHPGLLGVCLSGAGPSVLTLVSGGAANAAGVARALGALYDEAGVSHTIRVLEAHQPNEELGIRN